MGEIMIFFIIGFTAFFLSVGLFNISAHIFHLSKLATTKAVISVARQDKKKTKNIEAFIFEAATKLSKFIKLDDYKKRKLAATLKSAGLKMTPETYIAKAWIKSGLIALLIIPILLFLPILAPVIILLSIAMLFKDMRAADEIVRQKREEIEYELPRFVSNLTQSLKATRDVPAILKSYQKSAGEKFKQEIEITIADMNSGNEETALTRLESRIGSAMLSDVVRGLISVKRGDNGVIYFEMLNHDFKQLEIQKLKLLAMKQPGKIKKYSFMMLGCFLLIYLGILGYEIMRALGNMF